MTWSVDRLATRLHKRAAVVRLVRMVLSEQHDEWQVVRRYMSADSLFKARLEVIDGQAIEEVRGELVAAS